MPIDTKSWKLICKMGGLKFNLYLSLIYPELNLMNKRIFWIASYPKSGNTWMRAIILLAFYLLKMVYLILNLLKLYSKF